MGKIVIAQTPDPSPPFSIRPDVSYLVTGGLGGLGLTTAEHLVELGAQQIILVGRRPPSAEAMIRIQKISSHGAKITPFTADISKASDVQMVFDILQKDHLPLAGIIHAAGVIDDGLIVQQDWERFIRIFAPKVEAAWHLHRLTANLKLDFFVCYSAGAGLIGSAGQSGYAAANTELDAFIHYRQARGLPALSIAWGPWSEVGMAALMSSIDQERMSRQGLGFISPGEGVELLDLLLGATGAVAAIPVDWTKYISAHTRLPARFSEFARQAPWVTSGYGQNPHDEPGVIQQLWDAVPGKRKPILQTYLREQAIHVLGLSASYNLDYHQPLREIGMDSLMAVELRNSLSTSLHLKLPSTLLFDYPTVEALTDYLSNELWPEAQMVTESIADDDKPATSMTAISTEVSNLSDEEAEALLLSELELLQSSKKRKGMNQ